MIGFDLPKDSVEDPEALFRRTKAKLKKCFSFRIIRRPDKA
jgi:hypothetical protein